MKKLLTMIAIAAVLMTSAAGQDALPKDDRELTREEKNDALRRAYQLITEERQPPVALPKPRPVVTVQPKPRADICRRHGKRKVVSGRSWRCR